MKRIIYKVNTFEKILAGNKNFIVLRRGTFFTQTTPISEPILFSLIFLYKWTNRIHSIWRS